MGYWTNIDGVLKSISVGNSSNIWGYNANNEIFKKSDSIEGNWQGIPSPLGELSSENITSLSCGDDGHVLLCLSNQRIFRWIHQIQNWQPFPSTCGLTKVNVGNNYNIWGINDAGTGWIYTMDAVFLNTQNTEPLLDVSVGSDGSAIVLGNTKTIYRYLNPERRKDDTVYRKIEGISNVIEIATSTEAMMLAITDDARAPRLQIYRGENMWAEFPFKDINGNQIPEKIEKVSIGADGTIIGLTDNTAGPSNIWQYIPYYGQPPTPPTD